MFAYEKVFAAERHGEVVALTPDTGEVIWERNFAIFPEESFWDDIARLWRSGVHRPKVSALAAGYNMVFVATEDGIVRALDSESGETLWETTVAGEVLAKPCNG